MLNFGEISALQYCTGNFEGRLPRSAHLRARPVGDIMLETATHEDPYTAVTPIEPQEVSCTHCVFRYAGDHYGANRNSGREFQILGPRRAPTTLQSETTGNKARNGFA